MKDSGKTLLNKMEALKTYPFRDETPPEVEQEFEHASEYLKNDSKPVRLGTLSKSEWEAISELQNRINIVFIYHIHFIVKIF